MKERKIFIVTGLSGAGKSQALKVFEDFGFFCVDNLPVAFLDDFIKFSAKSSVHQRLALGMDIREGQWVAGLPAILNNLKKREPSCRIIYLDATDASIVRRFSETRHRHPLGGKIDLAIKAERRRLLPIKEIADKVIDTSAMTLGELKEAISQTLGLTRTREMTLSIVSFGYKYGLPMDADLVMDVRFLPNPNYVPALKKLTGLDKRVANHILKQPAAKKFLATYVKLVADLLPNYVREGKSYLTVAIGCTGGRHRSVFIARYLAEKLRGLGYPIQEFHRDISKGSGDQNAALKT